VSTLEELATDGIRLGIISNWDERLRVLLQRLKLDRMFETIVVSCEAGFAKPSPVIFELAAEKLGLPPASILHVGDSFEMDVQGARSAGFAALQLIRAEARPHPDAIRSLAELPARITEPISTC
jgi:putative hydrolase of the HAD superfamily